MGSPEPHRLSKASRFFLVNQLLGELCSIKKQGWQFIVTFDES
jgi:hypothetical protein